MIEEGGVHRLAHHIVAPEGEGDIADPTAYLTAWKRLLQDTCCLDKVDRVVIMLLDARSHRQDVGVEDNVLRWEADLFRQDAVGTRTDLHLSLDRIRLADLVEGHHYHASTIAPNQPRLLPELLLTLFQADGVDDPLALYALQPGLKDR